MPFFYPNTVRALGDGIWDRRAFLPDAGIVFLGNNDYSTQPQPQARDFEAAYHAFLQTMRQGRGGLPILCVYVADGSTLADCVQNVVAEEKSKGHRVESLGLPPIPEDAKGCDFHPKAFIQRNWAELAAGRIGNMLSWKVDLSAMDKDYY
jgi:hypothetical protein